MTFALRKNGPIESLESQALGPYDFIDHAFCTRHTGASAGAFSSLNVSLHVGDEEKTVRYNRAMIAEDFGIDLQKMILVNQVHGNGVLILDNPADSAVKHESAAFDALITNHPGFALCIKTADCVPIFLVDTAVRVICAVHAGWQGTALKIAAKVVDILFTRFHSKPENILAVIGPAIGPCCYEVDRRVYEAMDNNGMQKTPFRSKPKLGKWMLDLSLANKLQLLNTGIPADQIFSAELCTACRKDMFFSHRGEGGKTGRQLNFILLKK
jgi:YfiH family protein